MPWNDGYTTDVAYPLSDYERGLSPTFQSFCLLNHDIAADLPAEGHYLELGYGKGVSLNIHAATSEAQFWGTDFNPSHTSFAQTMADASGANLHLLDHSFEELAKHPHLPQFDVIALYGVWSWISNTNRAIIVKLIREHLKPRGIVYLSYNVTPGWSAMIPIRHLMTLYAKQANTQTDLNTQIESTLSFIQTLANMQTGYFSNIPDTNALLEKMVERNRHYLAHDIFNANWHPMPFSDAISWLNDAKITFSSSANPLDFIPPLNLPKEANDFLLTIEPPLLRESARDYLVNQRFRRDLFVRGSHDLTPLEAFNEKQRRRFALLKSPDKVPMATRLSRLRTSLSPAIYRPILAGLAENHWEPKSLAELQKLCAPVDISLEDIWQAMVVLVGEWHVIPVRNTSPSATTVSRCQSLNTFLLERSRSSSDINVLASPVAGAGIQVTRSEQLFLLAYREGIRTIDQLVEFAWLYLSKHPGNLALQLNENPTPRPAEERIAHLHERAQTFMNSRLAIFNALGIN